MKSNYRKATLTAALSLAFVMVLSVALPAIASFEGETVAVPVAADVSTQPDAVPTGETTPPKENCAPIAHNLSFETYCDMRLCERFIVTDNESNPCTFEVVKKPSKGTVKIKDDCFVYEPYSGKTGNDSFTYKATDSAGAVSKEATVTIRIVKKSKQTVFYTDLLDSPVHYEASKLAERGVFVGESIGAECFLYPAKPVTRAEFVAMVAAMIDMATPTAAIGTGLYDNEAIPTWAQPYVAAAVTSGIVEGESRDGNRVFRAEDAITRAEAATILDRALNLTNDGRVSSFADGEAIPTWAAQAIINTTATEIVSVFADGTMRPAQAVTREDAVDMLYSAASHLDSQVKKGGIFGFFR